MYAVNVRLLRVRVSTSSGTVQVLHMHDAMRRVDVRTRVSKNSANCSASRTRENIIKKHFPLLFILQLFYVSYDNYSAFKYTIRYRDTAC